MFALPHQGVGPAREHQPCGIEPITERSAGAAESPVLLAENAKCIGVSIYDHGWSHFALVVIGHIR